MLSRKYYVEIAKIIRVELMPWLSPDYTGGENAHGLENKVLTNVANNLANYFESDNPNFDRDKFLKACGLEV